MMAFGTFSGMPKKEMYSFDYYKILEVDKNAEEDDIREAYRKLAANWRPDLNPSTNTDAKIRFKQMSEAYEVLSDPLKRAIYDKYGEEGLKGHSPPPGAFGASGSSTFGAGPMRFTPRSADDVFSDSFGFSIPFSGGMFQGSMGPKAAPIEKTLPCSLEELYKGTTKEMDITRNIVDAAGRTKTEEETLSINIKPGWKKGRKITFPEKGDKNSNMIPADLVFVIDEKPHSMFTRNGDDLYVTKKITFAEAMTGYTTRLTTLDGRNLVIPRTDVILPNHKEIVPGEGMPMAKDPSKKGSLTIKFDVKFPTRLTEDQKAGINKLFPS